MADLSKPFRLGDWRVIPDRLTLEGEAGKKRIEPKAMAVLLFLAKHAGQTVSRETLSREVWKGTYGSDETLSRIISLLRTQLGDSSRQPSYIETIPKLGYRLLITPESIAGATTAPQSSSSRLLLIGTTFATLAILSTLYIVLRNEKTIEPQHQSLTIAILPFEDIGQSVADEYLSVGLTNEIVGDLNRSPTLRIVNRNTRENIGNDAGAIDYILTGNVAVIENRVRAYAEISDAVDGIVVWSDNFETDAEDYVSLQQEFSRLIFRGINRELGLELESPRREDIDIEAYATYLNGIFLSKLRGEGPLRASISAFQSALAIEPDFDNARVALANAQVLLPYYSAETEDSAFAAATSQLELVSTESNAEAEAILGFIAFRQWRWIEAQRLFENSLTLNPDIANTHVWYSQFLSTVGSKREALEHARIAFDLDPVSPVVNGRLANALLWLDQDEDARQLFAAAEDLGFDILQNRSTMVMLLRNDDYDAVGQGLRALNPDAEIDPLLANLENLENPETKEQLVAEVDKLIATAQLAPNLEFGVWIILEQWDRVVATIEKHLMEKKYLDIEVIYSREAESFRADSFLRCSD